MKILLQGINYYPELTGIGKYTAEMCEWLAAQGHDVKVITAMPYYPNWEVQGKYKGKWWHTENIKKVEVCRTPLYVPKKVTGITRIIHEFSFALFSLPFWLNSLFKKYDVVITVSPPFHIGFLALMFAKIKGIPVIYHVQDLQVDAARRLNMIKSAALLNILEKAESFIIKKVTKVSSISEGMKNNILNKGISEKKYLSLPNWVDIDFIKPLSQSQSLKFELGFKAEDNIVLYSGNLGEKQGLDMIIDAAESLKLLPNLYFVIIGEGANKKSLMNLVSSKNLSNVKFFPLQLYDRLSSMLAMADLHLVLQKKAAADLVLPSKLMTLLAAGGVAIVTAEDKTTLYDLIKNHNLGILIPPEDTNALVSAIQSNLNQDLSEIQKNSRIYAVEKLSIHQILTNFELELLKLQKSNG